MSATAPAPDPRDRRRGSAYGDRPLIVVHGGAGDWPAEVEEATSACEDAARAGLDALAGGSALDAVVAAVRVLEDAPSCNAATGAVLTSDRTLELDACVMDGATLRSGAVACLPPFPHPIDLARAVLEDGRYHLLVGEGAARFAVEHGWHPGDPQAMIRPERYAEVDSPTGPELERRSAEAKRDVQIQPAGNTVGAVALDAAGSIAAATSTGGIPGRHPGRVGDSPIVGAGTYANGLAGCSCTGDGEAFARAVAAFWAVEHAGEDPQASATAIVEQVREKLGGLGGAILLNCDGLVGVARSARAMPYAIARPGEPVVSSA